MKKVEWLLLVASCRSFSQDQKTHSIDAVSLLLLVQNNFSFSEKLSKELLQAKGYQPLGSIRILCKGCENTDC